MQSCNEQVKFGYAAPVLQAVLQASALEVLCMTEEELRDRLFAFNYSKSYHTVIMTKTAGRTPNSNSLVIISDIVDNDSSDSEVEIIGEKRNRKNSDSKKVRRNIYVHCFPYRYHTTHL